MNKNKELLIKDLTCRLSYGIKCLVEIDETEYDEFTGKDIGFKGKSIGELYLLDINDNHVELYFDEKNNISDELSDMSMEGLITINDIKPYLRSMSKMTEKETYIFCQDILNEVEARCIHSFGCGEYSLAFTEANDWLNEHHFDYRGLIEKGLALEAPEGMYN